MSKMLDGNWPQWLKENLERKCSPEELLGILLKNGFALESIRPHMGPAFPAHSALLKDLSAEALDQSPIDYESLARCRLTQMDSGLNVSQVFTSKLQLYTLENFLTPAECDHVIRVSRLEQEPSRVTTGVSGFRTSKTTNLDAQDDPFIPELDERIAQVMGIRVDYSEAIQAQHYEAGNYFKPHADYFTPANVEQFASEAGNRTWTFMIYLNEGMTGGGTWFCSINRIFTPRKGLAVIWNNLYPDGQPNPFTVHAGLPVDQGEKFIVTKWFREKGVGPMFYETAAQESTASMTDDSALWPPQQKPAIAVDSTGAA